MALSLPCVQNADKKLQIYFNAMKIEKNGAHTSLPAQVVSQEEPRKYLPGIWNQYYATFAVSIASFGIGASSGWVSPMILILESEESPVGPMTNLEISPLETLPAIAGLFGTLIFAYILTRFGRKPCGNIAAAISVTGWLALLSAKFKVQLYIGRFLTGMSHVGLAMIGPIYLSEIAYVDLRGTLMTYTQFSSHCGSLVSFWLGTVCDYHLFTLICMLGPVLFPFFFYRIPESPQFMLLKSKVVDAQKTLLWYRGGDSKLMEKEMNGLSNTYNVNMNFRDVLKDRGNRKAIIVFVFMFCFSIMAGTSVITGYASKIFENADPDMSDPNTSAAVLATIKFAASLAAIQLIDRFGRKALVVFSFISMSICLVTLTVYSFFQEVVEVDVSNLWWLPIVTLSTYVATYTFGVGTVAEIIASEMFTPEIKGVAIGFVGVLGTLFVLASLQLYAISIEFIGSYFNFLVESVFAISSIFIAWRIVPETKGKTVAEITEILRGNSPHINKRNEITRL